MAEIGPSLPVTPAPSTCLRLTASPAPLSPKLFAEKKLCQITILEAFLSHNRVYIPYLAHFTGFKHTARSCTSLFHITLKKSRKFVKNKTKPLTWFCNVLKYGYVKWIENTQGHLGSNSFARQKGRKTINARNPCKHHTKDTGGKKRMPRQNRFAAQQDSLTYRKR